MPLIVLFLLAPRILSATGQLPGLVVFVKQYFYALTWGAPGYVLLAAIQQALYGMSKQRLVIVGNVICLLIFIPVTYGLIFGKFGIPAQGVAGVAYGFAIQVYLNIIFLLLCFYCLKEFKSLALFEWRSKQRWNYVKQLLQIGWPMSAQFGGELVGFFVVSVMIGWLGSNALAAAQVTQQCLFLFVVPMFAVAEATGIMVSQAVGGKRYLTVKRIGEVCLWAATAVVLIFAVIFLTVPKFLASLYINVHDPNNAQIVHLVKILFILLAFSLVFDTWRNIATGALHGFYDTRFAMWVGIFIMWIIAVPFGYLLAFTFQQGVVGFRIASSVAFLIGAGLIWWRWRRRVKGYVRSQ